MTFKEKLLDAARANKSWLCVGLDPELDQIPAHFAREPESILKFNRAVIESTSGLVCAYKPNAAFYEALGSDGWQILVETVKSVPRNIPVILDFKRGDIGNTARMYARSAFEMVGADAVTVNPYLGSDSLKPFLDYREKGIFILCLTSNPSSAEIQRIPVAADAGAGPLSLYAYIAGLAVKWNYNDNLGLVVGATSPEDLDVIRHEIGDGMPILVPGIGAQGGDLEKAVTAGSNSSGELAIINVARGVIYAGMSRDFQTDIRQAARIYRDRIMACIALKAGKMQ